MFFKISCLSVQIQLRATLLYNVMECLSLEWCSKTLGVCAYLTSAYRSTRNSESKPMETINEKKENKVQLPGLVGANMTLVSGPSKMHILQPSIVASDGLAVMILNSAKRLKVVSWNSYLL